MTDLKVDTIKYGLTLHEYKSEKQERKQKKITERTKMTDDGNG